MKKLTLFAALLGAIVLLGRFLGPSSTPARATPPESSASKPEKASGALAAETDARSPETDPKASGAGAEAQTAAAPGADLAPAAQDPTGLHASSPGAANFDGVSPDPATLPEVRTHARRDDEGLTEVVHPDGTVTLDLQGRFRAVPVATQDAEGRVKIQEH